MIECCSILTPKNGENFKTNIEISRRRLLYVWIKAVWAGKSASQLRKRRSISRANRFEWKRLSEDINPHQRSTSFWFTSEEQWNHSAIVLRAGFVDLMSFLAVGKWRQVKGPDQKINLTWSEYPRVHSRERGGKKKFGGKETSVWWSKVFPVARNVNI